MNELEPDAQQQWLWFGAALLAMTIITYIATSFSEVACARLLCPRRNICLVSLMEQHFLIPPAARWCNSVEGRGEVHS
jgi:hypothetical protein